MEGVMRRRVVVACCAVLLVAGCVAGSAARHFVWDGERRYAWFPFLQPDSQALARALFDEAVCNRSGSVVDNESLLGLAGHGRRSDDDPFTYSASFDPPLVLQVKEHGIRDWNVLRYAVEGSSGGWSGIEVAQPVADVAQALSGNPHDTTLVLRRRVSPNGLIADRSVVISEEAGGTRIACVELDG
jgi:hypothetical protein